MFDELKYAENIIKNGYKNKKYINYDNIILVKYWKHKGCDKQEIKVKLKSLMKDFQNLYNDNIINYKIHRALEIGMKFELEFNKIVEIYQSELDTIGLLNDIELQKILFVLLVVWKYKNKNKFRITNSDILKLAEVKCNNNKFWDYLHCIFPTGYMNLVEYKNKDYYKINIPEEGNLVLTIDNFNNIINYYLSYLYPENYMKCQECEVPIRITNGNLKYCKDCAREIELINHRERNKKWYQKKISDEANNSYTPTTTTH